MTDYQIGRVLGLADELAAMSRKTSSGTFLQAIIADHMLQSDEISRRVDTAADRKDVARLAIRIHELMPMSDDPRFSLYDWTDAVINATGTVSVPKLLALDDDGFVAAVTWLAVDKRETYEDRPHAQEPLELDIYEPTGGDKS